MKKTIATFLFCIFLIHPAGEFTSACTSFLITKGASADGSTMISYAADSHTLYGELYHWPAGEWPEGAMLDLYEWHSGKHMGRIPQARKTYNVVGNMNEHQLAISETTYGGRSELKDTTGIIDYGNMMYLALQRAKTAREAIRVFHELVTEFGYASSGESISIADKDEVWILEIIGKGTKMETPRKGGEPYNANKGAVWVARMIPDGYISGHANHARITTFPQKGKSVITSKNIDKIHNKEVTTVYAHDVISFAKESGFYEGPDELFSFSDVYAPMDFGAARFCEARVWTMFNKITSGMDTYWEYAKGNIKWDVKPAEGRALKPENFPNNRMPLWMLPEKKVTLQDAFGFMRDHFEGTELDMSLDVGAGPFSCPYRWRPMQWEVDGVEYIHERTISTQQTAFTFVSQSRSWLPDEIGGLIWWGYDDTDATVYTPFYTSITRVPATHAAGNGDSNTWSETSGFWIFNQVSNLGYTRYNVIHPEIRQKQQEYEAGFIGKVAETDKNALEFYKSGREASAVQYLTDYSVAEGEKLVMEWKAFYQYLFMKYYDGNRRITRPLPPGNSHVEPKAEHPKYNEDFYRLIIEKTGDKLKVIEE